MNHPQHGIGPTRILADWVAGLHCADLPPRTRERVREALLDTIASALYGRNTPWTRAVLGWARAGGGGSQATVLGEARPSLRASEAALVNATSAHAFELDDYHQAKLHPGAVVIPAALALGERVGADGERLLAAIAAGYEVMIRSSLALEPAAARLRGWHLTGVCGPLGAAAAGAVLLGLDAERSAWALGLGGTQGAGLWAFNADGAMSKRLHGGKAAECGVLAAELAEQGYTGPTLLYEAPDGGFLRAYSDASDPLPLVEGLGRSWRLDSTAVKPYSCCGSLHAYVDAARELRERHGRDALLRAPIRAGLPRVIEVQCGFDYAPSTELNAQMSARYCIAAALEDGNALPPQFAAGRIARADTVARAARIELVHDPELDEIYPREFCGWVEADIDGRRERVFRRNPSGSPALPLDFEGIAAKYRPLLGDAAVARIADAAGQVERLGARGVVAAVAGCAATTN